MPDLGHLRPGQLDAALARVPLAYLAVGATEYHGRHLPVGLDTLKAQALVERAAARTGGLVLPPLPLGSGGEHGAFPWTWMIPASTLLEILRALLTGLEAQGVRVIVLLSGHYPNHPLCEEAARRHALAGGTARVLSLVDYQAFNGDPDPHADHAGRWETALQLALHPQTVDLTALATSPDGATPDDFPPPVATTPGGWWFEKRPAHPWHGIAMPENTRPDTATPADGQAATERIVTWLAHQAQTALAQANPCLPSTETDRTETEPL